MFLQYRKGFFDVLNSLVILCVWLGCILLFLVEVIKKGFGYVVLVLKLWYGDIVFSYLCFLGILGELYLFIQFVFVSNK